ncbi:MAG: hypothetical protein M3N34_09370 [Pseudomonadota bacterium]|nr:hypothetical protein [Pseudomonadota bacterium]
MYDGRCHAEFAFALCQLSALCPQLGIGLEFYFASGEALVMKARNAIADRFLRSDATHLMLIDADIGFQAVDVLALLALQMGASGRNDYDLVSAPYPIKRMAWEQIDQAARQGLAEADPANLQNFAARLLLRPAHGGAFDMSQPLEVTEAGTGFMMIRRATLKQFQAHYPHHRYKSDGIGIERGSSALLTQFFDTAIDGQTDTLEGDLRGFMTANPAASHAEILSFMASRTAAGGHYISEDFMFCRLLRGMGLKLWSCPWMTLSHIGSFTFTSGLSEIAKLGT